MNQSIDNRFDYFKSLLHGSSFFKLVCGAGNENVEEVRRLAFIFTLAGCSAFDVSANPLVVRACKQGIDQALELEDTYYYGGYRPLIVVSVGMPGDHHVRKAFITDSCVSCNLCIPVCPTDAIPSSLVITKDLCIGCGNCESVCPPAASAISYEHNHKKLEETLPLCLAEGAESFELHAGVPDDSTTFKEFQTLCNLLPNGFVSMCLDRQHLSNASLIERIKKAFEVAGKRLIIQADGIPMSGGSDDLNTTLQAISIADIINKQLIKKSKPHGRIPILLSGGTNSYTGKLARNCDVPFSGITIGTHARKTVKSYLSTPLQLLDNESIDKAVSAAYSLITANLRC